MAVDFGTCLDMTTDLPLRWSMANGFRNLANNIVRRLVCAPGTIHYSPDDGFDVRSLCNSKVTTNTIGTYQSQIARQCERDGRVIRAVVSIVYTQATSTATINISLDTSNGPFKLVLGVSDVTVAILRAQ